MHEKRIGQKIEFISLDVGDAIKIVPINPKTGLPIVISGGDKID